MTSNPVEPGGGTPEQAAHIRSLLSVKQSFSLPTLVPILKLNSYKRLQTWKPLLPTTRQSAWSIQIKQWCKLGITANATIPSIFLFRTTYVSFCLFLHVRSCGLAMYLRADLGTSSHADCTEAIQAASKTVHFDDPLHLSVSYNYQASRLREPLTIYSLERLQWAIHGHICSWMLKGYSRLCCIRTTRCIGTFNL